MAATSQDLSMLLARAARLVRTRQAAELAPLGLHAGQDALLRCLWQADGQTQADLAGQLGVEAPTVTKMVARLEAAGFVKRKAHPRDRRASQVWLTSQGRQVRANVNRARTRVATRMTAGLSDRQRATLESLLGKVGDNLDDGPS
jgi:DNA-binding MarR family transcriptional regulator